MDRLIAELQRQKEKHRREGNCLLREGCSWTVKIIRGVGWARLRPTLAQLAADHVADEGESTRCSLRS
jgi:hypothetical protein